MKEKELRKAENALEKTKKPTAKKEEVLSKAESVLIQEDYDLPPPQKN